MRSFYFLFYSLSGQDGWGQIYKYVCVDVGFFVCITQVYIVSNNLVHVGRIPFWGLVLTGNAWNFILKIYSLKI